MTNILETYIDGTIPTGYRQLEVSDLQKGTVVYVRERGDYRERRIVKVGASKVQVGSIWYPRDGSARQGSGYDVLIKVNEQLSESQVEQTTLESETTMSVETIAQSAEIEAPVEETTLPVAEVIETLATAPVVEQTAEVVEAPVTGPVVEETAEVVEMPATEPSANVETKAAKPKRQRQAKQPEPAIPDGYKAIDSATIAVGATVFLKYLKDEYAPIAEGVVTRKTPGLSIQIGGQKYVTNSTGWGGQGKYRIFTR